MVTAMNRSGRRRRGLTIVEIGVSIVLLAAAMTLIAQILLVTARTRREIQRQQIAALELGNAMERLARLPADRADDSTVQNLKLSEEAVARLPKAKLSGTATRTADDGKRIHLELTWDGGVARLTSYRYGASAERKDQP